MPDVAEGQSRKPQRSPKTRFQHRSWRLGGAFGRRPKLCTTVAMALCALAH